VGFAVDLFILGKTLAKNEGISKSRPPRSDVYRATSSEVKRWEIKEPAISLSRV
jgi:hypothetical protein